MTTPLGFNHVGIGVPDIESAVAWYRDVLGCIVLVEPTVIRNDGTHFGNEVRDFFGNGFQSMKMAHLTTGEGIGIELFQFILPEPLIPDDPYEYWRIGPFHICLTAPNIEEIRNRIVQNGGHARGGIWTVYANKDYRAAYCQDPWGTIIELCTHPYSQSWSNLETPQTFEE